MTLWQLRSSLNVDTEGSGGKGGGSSCELEKVKVVAAADVWSLKLKAVGEQRNQSYPDLKAKSESLAPSGGAGQGSLALCRLGTDSKNNNAAGNLVQLTGSSMPSSCGCWQLLRSQI